MEIGKITNISLLFNLNEVKVDGFYQPKYTMDFILENLLIKECLKENATLFPGI